jgi:hypothetical protein
MQVRFGRVGLFGIANFLPYFAKILMQTSHADEIGADAVANPHAEATHNFAE